MESMIIFVSEQDSGWIVKAANQMGPFLSRERATDLAEGMAAAMRCVGTPAEVVYGTLEGAAAKRAD